jgi:hypothetical protein
VFQKPRYLQSTFSIVFPRKPFIRKEAFKFEQIVESLYIQPRIIDVPDEINPDMPRIIFISKDGSGQLIISQINFIVNLTYINNIQSDVSKYREDLIAQVLLLFKMLENIQENHPYFCGLNTLVQIPIQGEDNNKIISRIYNLFSENNRERSISPFDNNANGFNDIYEFQVKSSNVIDEKFFSNTTVQNYNTWATEEIHLLSRLSSKKITETGIQIIGDFNDRYAFNELESYFCSKDSAITVVESGFDKIYSVIKQLTRG